MPKINKLDQVTINRIAAGEVIERPASVVKELIENSLDAGAQEITIDISNGGKDLIRVSDNGSGIEKEDLLLAPIRHATSKITSLEDIYSNSSYGFRGEALASIASVGSLDITSKHDEDTLAYKIKAEDTTISEPISVNRSHGTTVECFGLFEKIPVRQRFLKSKATEVSHIHDVIFQYALICPEVDFIFTSDGSEMLNTRGLNDTKTLISKLFGKKTAEHIVPVDEQIGDIHFSGYISDPTLTFSNRNKQIIGINKRALKSGVISKAIQNAYRDIIPPRRFPLLVLTITMPPDTIDVNVHPQKLDVKFLQPGMLFDSLPKVISVSLQRKHNVLNDLNTLHTQTSPLDQSSISTSALPQGILPLNTNNDAFAKYPSPQESDNAIYSHTPLENLSGVQYHADEPAEIANFDDALRFSQQEIDSKQPTPSFEYLHLFDTYIVVKGPDALWLLDQHAVHERILYEQIKDNFGKTAQRQKLLIAEYIEVNSAQLALFNEYQTYFASLHFEIEAFGNDQLVVREVPIEFTQSNIQTLILDLLEQLSDFPESTIDLTLEKKEELQMKACKAAIKAGKTLAPEEIEKLIQDFMSSPNNFTCPHGRPLFIKYTKKEFEKLFNRT